MKLKKRITNENEKQKQKNKTKQNKKVIFNYKNILNNKYII